ncbi:uncharacterized protein ACWYII_007731 [Salvelinus alpinus]
MSQNKNIILFKTWKKVYVWYGCVGTVWLWVWWGPVIPMSRPRCDIVVLMTAGMCKSKDKIMRSQFQKPGCTEPGCVTPVRPQSAKIQRSCSASGSSVRDRPMSSLGCLSQATLPQSSSHADTTSELLQQDLVLHVDLSQSEEEPVIIL